MFENIKIYVRSIVLLLAVVIVTSCASRKEVVYFQDTGDFETLVNNNDFVSKFKVDDLVSIHVSSLNPEASSPFNLFRGAGEGGFQAEQVDYLVDQAGEIDFPVIGKLKIEGLSPDEFKRFSRLVNSPFFNTNPTQVELYKLLKKEYPDFDSPKLSKEKVFQKLYPGRTFHYHRMSNIMSEMTRLVEEFLTQVEMERGVFKKRKMLVKALGYRNM